MQRRRVKARFMLSAAGMVSAAVVLGGCGGDAKRAGRWLDGGDPRCLSPLLVTPLLQSVECCGV